MTFNFPTKYLTVLILQMAMSYQALSAFAVEEPFEDPAPGTSSAWTVQNGSASLVSGQVGATGKALKLDKGTGAGGTETKVVRPLPWNVSESVAFIDFLIKPAANPGGSAPSVFVNGAEVAFQNGRVWALHGNDHAEPGVKSQWSETPASYDIVPGGNEATTFLRVTLRHDYGRDIWDLFVDGKMVAANFGFNGRGANLEEIEFYGSLVGNVHLDQLQADPANMLFPDADKDGLPDAWEIANGSNPNVYDRDAINPLTGKSFLQGYLDSIWSGANKVPHGSLRPQVSTSGKLTALSTAGHQPVGALNGSLSVGGDGSAVYTVPIDLPKGTAGMEPKLSLNYSSNAGNGLYGVGWGLSGLQKITRGPSSAVKDGQYDPVDFDVHDRFFLDGERLICVSGTYGEENSEYRTEMDGFARAILKGSGVNQYWTLETKAGLIVELGNTADSRELAAMPGSAASPGVLSWSVNKMSDTVGNYYVVEYTADVETGFSRVNHRVNRIGYTGHANGRAPYCWVLFDYDTRPDPARAYSTYAGYKVSKRLTKIRVTTDTYVNHSYRLSYTSSYQSSRSFLTQIQKFAKDDSALGIPATTFTYDGITSGEPLWMQKGGSTFPEFTATIPFGSVVDAPGNTSSNLTVGEDGLSVRLDGNVSRSYVPSTPLTVYSDTVLSFEFRSSNIANGAVIGLGGGNQVPTGSAVQIGGTSSILGILGPAPIAYAPGTPGGWVSYSVNIGTTPGARDKLVLMSRDGTNSVANAEFRNIRIYRSGTQQPGDVLPISFPLDMSLPRLRDSTGKDLGTNFIDLNNDGLPDLCNWRATKYVISGTTMTPETVGEVYRNIGTGFVADPTLRPPTSMPLSCRAIDAAPAGYGKTQKVFASPIDINNDGRTDLFASTNLKWAGASLSNDLTFHTLVNGVWQELPEYKLPFRAKTIASQAPYGAPRYHHYEWRDLDSDGYADLIIHTTPYGTLVTPDESTVILAGNKSIAYLNKVHLGQGWVASTSLGLPEPLQIVWPDAVSKGRQLIDIDGNGRLDIVEAVSAGYSESRRTYQMTSLVDGTLTGWNSTPGAQDPPASPFDLPVLIGSAEYNMPLANSNGSGMATRIIDLNGDGLPDLETSTNVGATNVHGVILNRGAAFGPWAKELRTSGTAPTAAQANTYDIPVPLTFQHSSGNIYPFGAELADLNGDGLVDILRGQEAAAVSDSNLAALNTGDGWLLRPEWKMPIGTSFYNGLGSMNDDRMAQLIDLNGDGFPDLVTDIKNLPKIWINQCRPEVLKSVVDGYQNQLAVEYQRMNDATPVVGGSAPAYTPYTGALPAGQAAAQGPRLLVSRLIEPDGQGGTRVARHYYGDLRSDLINGASLGFGWSEVHKDLYPAGAGQVKQGYSRTETSQRYPNAGSPVLTQSYVYLASGDSRLPGVTAGYHLVSEETGTYGELEFFAGVGGYVRRPVQVSSVTTKWDLAGVMISRAVTQQNYETPLLPSTTWSWDNTVKKLLPSPATASALGVYGFAASSSVTALDGSSVTTANTYQHTVNSTKWHLGRLSKTVVTKTPSVGTPITKQSQFTYDPAGLIASESVEATGVPIVGTAYTRDASGNATSTAVTTDGMTRTTSATYDARQRFVDKETDTLGNVIEHGYDDQAGLVLKTTDIGGQDTTYEYDAFGTKLITRNPDGTGTAEITRYASNADLPASVLSELNSDPQIITEIKWAREAEATGAPRGVVYFDAAGREVVSKEIVMTACSAGGTPTFESQYTIVKFDNRGRKLRESAPFILGDAPLWTTFEYDPLDRVMATLHPDGTSDGIVSIEAVSLSYPGAASSQPVIHSVVRNRKGGQVHRWDDQNGRLVKSSDPSGQATFFSHDAEGRVTSVNVAGIEVLRNTWDGLGRKVQIQDADGGTSFSKYNGFGEVTESTNARGQKTTTTFDGGGRVIQVVKPGAEGTWLYSYVTSGLAKGKPFEIRGPNGYSETFAYGNFGRLIKTTRVHEGETFVSRIAYTELGSPEYATDEGGVTTKTVYDPVYGSFVIRTELFSTSTGPVATVLSRFVSSDLISGATPKFISKEILSETIERVTETNAKTGQVEAILSTRLEDSKVVQNLNYTWDANGNLTSRRDNLVGKTETFGYDEDGKTLDRLTSSVVSGQVAVTYAYDARGNLIQKGNDTLVYSGSRPHAVSSAVVKGAARSYSYDAEGNALSDGTRTFAWTSFGQLSEISQSSCPLLKTFTPTTDYTSGEEAVIQGIPSSVQFQQSTAQGFFEFDGGGKRISQRVKRTFLDSSEAEVKTLYRGAYERETYTVTPALGTTTVSKTIHRHTLGGAVYTVENKAGSTGPVARLSTILTDPLGSTDVILVSEWNGSGWALPKAERQSFTAWGERRNSTTWEPLRNVASDDNQTSGADYKRGYTGHEMLDDFGLVHMNGRIYDAEIGRFLSPDPVVQVPEWSQNFNRYSYVLNNPLSHTDPTGHKISGFWKAFAMLVIAVVATALGQAYAMYGLGLVTTSATTGAITLTSGGMAVAGAIGGTIMGAANAALNGGSGRDILKAAVVGGISGAITGGVLGSLEHGGNLTNDFLNSAAISTKVLHTAGHGLVGGATNEAMGGKFQDGFLSGVAGAAATHLGLYKMAESGGLIGQAAAIGIVGGTATAIGGGKFANGAFTASFQFLLNHTMGEDMERWFGDKMVSWFGAQGTGSYVDGFARSSAAMIDGMLPGQQLKGEYNIGDDGMQLSYGGGRVSRELAIMVAGGKLVEKLASLRGLFGAAKGGGITLNSGGAGSVVEASIVRNINKGEKIADLMAEAKAITFSTGNEVAAVSLQNGQRALVQGGSGGISNLEALGVRRILGHTHPYGGTGPVVPSAGDFAALRQLGQRYSYIIERGQVIRFNSP